MFPRNVFSLYTLLFVSLFVGTAIQKENGDAKSALFAKEPNSAPRAEIKKRRIIFIGGHPGDPEAGCGGLISRLTRDGHEVTLAYATCFRGDRKINGEPEAQLRRRESEDACKVLGATPYFFDYAHEKLIADHATLEVVSSWLKSMHPDVVVTHWPVDTHPNHHVTSSLVWQSYLRDKRWSLYFFEVLNDRETVAFKPDLFLDIGDSRDAKKQACYCHRSQQPEGFWFDHEDMHRLRGAKCGVEFAEAYVLAEALPGRAALPVPFLRRRN